MPLFRSGTVYDILFVVNKFVLRANILVYAFVKLANHTVSKSMNRLILLLLLQLASSLVPERRDQVAVSSDLDFSQCIMFSIVLHFAATHPEDRCLSSPVWGWIDNKRTRNI